MGRYRGLLGGPVGICPWGGGKLSLGVGCGGTLARQPAEGLGEALGIVVVICP